MLDVDPSQAVPASGPSSNDDRSLLAGAARRAGHLALDYFDTALKTWTKDGDSPVSEADLAVDRLLHESLLAERPDYGWLSEESDDNPDRRARERVFIVDPIDGTRGFLAGRDEWCVSLAIVGAGRPIAAAVYNPVRDELFSAHAGGGATLNGNAIAASLKSDITGARVAAPRSLLKGGRLKTVDRQGWIASLAYRLSLVACGRLDGTAVRQNSCDWDLAAADLLVHEAGAKLTTLDGTAPVYNRAETKHGVLVAAGSQLQHQLASAVRGVVDQEAG